MIKDCKVVDAKIGYRDVKVIVEIHNSGIFSSLYKMKVHLVDEHELEIEAKGDYSLIRLAFDSFNTIHANAFAERMFKVKEGRKNSSMF